MGRQTTRLRLTGAKSGAGISAAWRFFSVLCAVVQKQSSEAVKASGRAQAQDHTAWFKSQHSHSELWPLISHMIPLGLCVFICPREVILFCSGCL